MPKTYVSLKDIAAKLGTSYGALRQYMRNHPELEWPEVREIRGVTQYWILKDVPQFRQIRKNNGF